MMIRNTSKMMGHSAARIPIVAAAIRGIPRDPGLAISDPGKCREQNPPLNAARVQR